MKFTPSVLVAALSGSSGGVVASRWKGTPYFRARITPGNPNTEDQQEQRGFMRQQVNWWQALPAGIKTYLDVLGANLGMSGFNAYIKQNVKDLADDVDLRIIPTSSDIVPVQTLGTAAGVLPGEIDITWDAGEAIPTNLMRILLSKHVLGSLDGPNAFLYSELDEAVSLEALTLSGLEAGESYDIFLFVKTLAAETYSVALYATDTATAA